MMNYEIDGREVEARTRDMFARRWPGRYYDRLSYWQQSWLWDRVRTELQAEGVRVRTRATWACPRLPVQLPVDGLTALRARLLAAKLKLPAIPADVAALIVHAEGVVAETLRGAR